ncbi:MAG: hypothetical protein ACC656_04975 [Candidatus Heimdallarchaeota archaeon]
MKYNKLSIFDFDNTLFFTHQESNGKREWFNKTNNYWPHKSWWDQADSLNYKILDIKPNQHVIKKLKEAFKDNHTFTILLTGRPVGTSSKMEKAIKKLLKYHNVNQFNLILLNKLNYLDLDFKLKKLDQLKQKLKCEKWEFYDDKYSYASTFVSWGIKNIGINFKYFLV